jgi:hypothetical protein
MYAAAASVLSNKDLTNKLVIGVLLGAGGFLIYKASQNSARNTAQKALDNSPEAQQANNLMALLHPYSYKKLSINPFEVMDIARDKLANVDEEAVIREAGTIRNLDKVQGFYSMLSGNRLNLTDDIRNILDSGEQKRFYEKININKANSETKVRPFDLYASPSGNNKYTNVWEDTYLKKVLFGYPKGTKIGTVSKKITVPFKDSKGVVTKVSLYYIKGSIGQIKDKFVYVLESQVSKSKPK